MINARYIFLALFVGLLLSCSHSPTIPVVDRSVSVGSNIKNTVHIVDAGDTVFSIAFNYDLDYKKMASANGIEPPYTINPGQRIRLIESAIKTKSLAKKSTSGRLKKMPVVKKKSVTKINKSPVNKTAIDSEKLKWQWPSQGKVIGKFSTVGVGNKGIDIEGREGAPVFSSETGKVVYAGDRLVGYGNLILIKHNDEFLSAYAHNRKVNVKEGDVVTRGQKIAEIGSSGTNSTKLHFEIRQKGRPVNPLYKLPRR